jgi:hypothetical protein
MNDDTKMVLERLAINFIHTPFLFEPACSLFTQRLKEIQSAQKCTYYRISPYPYVNTGCYVTTEMKMDSSGSSVGSLAVCCFIALKDMWFKFLIKS